MWTSILTILAALATILPQIVAAVRDGQIKTGAYDEILSALVAQQTARADRAIAARDGPDDGLSDDGFDRSRRNG
jgi:hypothetical protein